MAEIRFARPLEDLQVVAQFLEAHEKEEAHRAGILHDPTYFLKEAALRIGDSQGQVMIAWIKERPVGMIVVRQEDVREGWCGCLYVRPGSFEAAHQLIRWGYIWFRHKQIEHVFVAVSGRNRHRRFYQKMGFVPVYEVHRSNIEQIGKALGQ